jgi:hypothetical protein
MHAEYRVELARLEQSRVYSIPQAKVTTLPPHVSTKKKGHHQIHSNCTQAIAHPQCK